MSTFNVMGYEATMHMRVRISEHETVDIDVSDHVASQARDTQSPYDEVTILMRRVGQTVAHGTNLALFKGFGA